MPRGIKNFVVLATLLTWMAVVLVTLFRGGEVSAGLVTGVPALVIGGITGADWVINVAHKKTDGEDGP